MKRVNMGGQAVMEGVMIAGERKASMAVRRKDGSITLVNQARIPFSDKHVWGKWPVIRGMVNLCAQLKLGYVMLMKSANFLEEDETGETSVTGGFGATIAIIASVALSLGLFFVLPSLVSGWALPANQGNTSFTLLEGFIRLLLFGLYMLSVGLMKDMKRVYMYHGAEHKVLHCIEHELPPTVENAKKFSRLHPRCGTSYLFLVMMVSMVFFAVLGRGSSILMRVLLRIAFIPLVAGVAYEILRFAGRYDGVLSKIIRAPGMLLQYISTREPEDDMIEVAADAYEAAIDND